MQSKKYIFIPEILILNRKQKETTDPEILSGKSKTKTKSKSNRKQELILPEAQSGIRSEMVQIERKEKKNIVLVFPCIGSQKSNDDGESETESKQSVEATQSENKRKGGFGDRGRDCLGVPRKRRKIGNDEFD